MNRQAWAAACCLLGGVWSTVAGQELSPKPVRPPSIGVINDRDVTAPDLTLESLDQPPARKIDFERIKEPVSTRLVRPDPKLVEQKYVAIVRLKLPEDQNRLLHVTLADDVSPLQYWSGAYLLHPRIHPSSSVSRKASEWAKLVLKFVPPDRRPPAAEVEFFTSEDIDRGLITSNLHGGKNDGSDSMENYHEFRILATSPEEAERRSAAFLTLLDQGVARPIRLDLFKQRGSLVGELQAARKSQTNVNARVIDLRRQLDSLGEYTPEMLPGLRVQQMQLDVDLAGVKARLAACEKLLAQEGPTRDRRQQLEDAKFAAEIELAGFEARRAKSEEFVGKVRAKIELLEKYKLAQFEQSGAQVQSKTAEGRIRRLDQAIAYFALPLVESQVIIAPLVWYP